MKCWKGGQRYLLLNGVTVIWATLLWFYSTGLIYMQIKAWPVPLFLWFIHGADVVIPSVYFSVLDISWWRGANVIRRTHSRLQPAESIVHSICMPLYCGRILGKTHRDMEEYTNGGSLDSCQGLFSHDLDHATDPLCYNHQITCVCYCRVVRLMTPIHRPDSNQRPPAFIRLLCCVSSEPFSRKVALKQTASATATSGGSSLMPVLQNMT